MSCYYNNNMTMSIWVSTTIISERWSRESLVHVTAGVRPDVGVKGTLARLVNESLPKRGALSLGLFWIKSKSLTDTDSLPPSGLIVAEIAYDLAAALEEFTRLGRRLPDDRSVPVGWISEA